MQGRLENDTKAARFKYPQSSEKAELSGKMIKSSEHPAFFQLQDETDARNTAALQSWGFATTMMRLLTCVLDFVLQIAAIILVRMYQELQWPT